MSRKYQVASKGRMVNVTVPEDVSNREILIDAIKESMSPEAVAAMVPFLRSAQVRKTKPEVTRQINWFANVLAEAVGGDKRVDELCADVLRF